MAITFSRSYQTSDNNCFGTLELAQAHELTKLIESESPRDGTSSISIANILVKNADAIVDILTLNKNSRPRARRSQGGKKPRKTKPETPTLPGV